MKKVLISIFISSVFVLSGCSSNIDNYEKMMELTEKRLQSKEWETKIKSATEAMQREYVIDYFKVDDALNTNEQLLNLYLTNIKDSLNRLKELDKSDFNSANTSLAQKSASVMIESKRKFNDIINSIINESNFVRNFRTKYVDDMVKLSLDKTNKLDVEYTNFIKIVNKAKQKHNDRLKDIESIQTLGDDIYLEITDFKKAMSIVKSNSGNVSSEDMVALYNQFTKSKTINYVEYLDELSSKLNELDDTYIKILKSKHAIYSAQISGVTWDSYSDWDTTKQFAYPDSQISERAYKKYKSGYSEKCRRLSQCRNSQALNLLTAQKISKLQDYGNDDGEFWLEDIYGEFYHQYDIIVNGKVTTTEMVEVSEATYMKYYDDVGKSIYSKPYGKFDDEANTVAKPPGSSMVGNPQYGHWQKDSSGNDVWFWVAMWSMMNNHNSTPYYSRDYNSYNRYRVPNNSYYNNSRNNGARSTSRYSQTNISKRSSTRPSFAKSTVRNGSSSNKGRGSSGGGK